MNFKEVTGTTKATMIEPFFSKQMLQFLSESQLLLVKKESFFLLHIRLLLMILLLVFKCLKVLQSKGE